MDKFIIDRIEGDLAVCEKEDLSMVDIALVELPEGIVAGDCIFFDGMRYIIDVDATKERKRIIKSKMNELFAD